VCAWRIGQTTAVVAGIVLTSYAVCNVHSCLAHTRMVGQVFHMTCTTHKHQT